VEALWLDSSRRLGLALVVVEPVDPFRGGEFDVGETVPGPTGLDQLSIEASVLARPGRSAVGVGPSLL
jgi:hypothetical protein